MRIWRGGIRLRLRSSSIRLRLCAGLCVALLAVEGCSNPNRYAAWNGTWKLNIAESQAHNYLSIGVGPDGVATVTTEGMDFSYRCDGSAISMGQGRTGFCNPVNEAEWKISYKINGQDSGTSLWDLSPDQNTFAVRAMKSGTDAALGYKDISTYTRRSGTKGFAGRWEADDPFRARFKTLRLEIHGGYLRWVDPQFGQYYDAPLNGITVPIQRSLRVGEGVSVRPMSSKEFYIEWSVAGRIIRGGTFDMGDDGRTMVERSWKLANPEDQDRLVYEKQ